MNSNLIYYGKVTVKIKNKPPIRKHNSGTTHLFRSLYSTLADPLNVTLDNYPGYMCIVNNIQSVESEYKGENKLIHTEMYINQRSATNDGVKFTALLNHNNTSSDKKFNKGDRLLLLNASRTYVLAHVTVSEEQAGYFNVVNKDSNGQCVIEWEMSFGNNEQGGTN